MRDMACSGPYFSKILLNAIYFGASKFSPKLEVRKDPEDVRTAGYQYRSRVKELLGSCLDSSNITTIQALLMMAQSLFALGDERSAAWLYAGIAFRMLVDLGIHADISTLQSARRLSDEDIEIRRRVFWGAFVVDKMQSLYQGRPVSLQTSDSRVPISFLDTYEEFEHWKPFAYTPETIETYPGSPAYSVSTFTGLCQLSVIMNGILNDIYAEATFDKSPEELSDLQKNLDSRLKAWYSNLPSHLKLDPSKPSPVIPPPHVLSLIAMYNVLLILLHRPFVSDGHLHSTARSITVNSLLVCANAATAIVQILRLYHQAFSVRRAPYLIAYATYVSATIHIRIAAKRSSGSDAQKSLATCLEVFSLNQGTNWAATRAKNIVESLAKKLDIDLPEPTGALTITSSDARPSDPYPPTPVTSDQQYYIPNDPSWQQGFSPTMDVDAIIQSFAREQENAQVMSNSMGAAYTGGENTGFVMATNPYPTETSNWMDPNKFSFDDLLFGFNNPTLDNFSAPFQYNP